MAKRKTTKEQIIIDLKYKEIKGTNKSIEEDINRAFEDAGLEEYFSLYDFKIVSSLTDDKMRAPKNFKPITYKTRKRDIIDYLESIKNSDRKLYDEYMTALEEDDFVVINKKFNEEVITTEEQKEKLQEIIEKNNILKKQEDEEKERIKAIKQAKREQRKAEREKKKEENKQK